MVVLYTVHIAQFCEAYIILVEQLGQFKSSRLIHSGGIGRKYQSGLPAYAPYQ